MWTIHQPPSRVVVDGIRDNAVDKLGVVTAILAVAYLAQRRLDPKVLRRTVPAEMALGLAIVVVMTILTSQAPARTIYGPPLSLTAPLDTRSARIHINTT